MLDQILERWNLRRAFERVQESYGCQGADGMTVGRFAADLERELDRLQDRPLTSSGGSLRRVSYCHAERRLL